MLICDDWGLGYDRHKDFRLFGCRNRIPNEEPLGELSENIGNIDGSQVAPADCPGKLWIFGNRVAQWPGTG